MNQSDILEQIKSLLNSSEKAIIEIQNGVNIDFYKALVQKNSIDSFNLSSQISATFKKPEKPNSFEKVIIQESPIVETTLIEDPMVSEIQLNEKVNESITTVIEETKTPEPTKTVEKTHLEIKIEEPIVKVVPPPIQEIKTEEKLKSIIKPQNTKSLISNEDDEEEISINDKISKNKAPVLNYADKSIETAIPELSKAISIGKKFEFINGLFNGNSEVYKLSIQTLQNAENYQKAINYIETEITNQYDWNENEKLAAEFFALIRRRFN